jgi:hypothetical protein
MLATQTSFLLGIPASPAGRTYKLKIYPPYGNSPQDGHTFGYFGSAIWADDVFQFLNDHCVK